MVEWLVASVAIVSATAVWWLFELQTEVEDERRRRAFHAIYDFARACGLRVGEPCALPDERGPLTVLLTDRTPTVWVRAPTAAPVACVVRDHAPGPSASRTGDPSFDRAFAVYAGASFCTMAVRMALVQAAAAGCHVRIGSRGVEVHLRLPDRAQAIEIAVGHARRIRAALPELELEALRDQATGDPIPRVRFAAWDALQLRAPDLARDALLAALGDADPYVRTEAARRLGDPQAMLAILGDLTMPESARARALRSLLALRDPRYDGLAVRIAMRDRTDAFRRRVLREAGRGTTAERLDALLDLWRTGSLLAGPLDLQRTHARLIARMLRARPISDDEEELLLDIAEIPGAGREAVRTLALRGSVRAVPVLRVLQSRIGWALVDEAVLMIQTRSRGEAGAVSLAEWGADEGALSEAEEDRSGWLAEPTGSTP